MAGFSTGNSTDAAAAESETNYPAAPRFWQLVYFLLTIVACFMLLPTLFPRVDFRLPLTLMVLALLLLTLKRWTGVLFLCVLQLHAFVTEGARFPTEASVSFVWGLMCVALVVVVSRYRTLQERDNQSVFFSLGKAISTVRKPALPEVQILADNLLKIVWQLVKTALMITVCAVVAYWLLSSVPLDLNAVSQVGLQPTGHRLIVLALKLFIIALVSWIAVNEIVWRSLSRKQAGIYVRSTFLNWIHRDFRMVVARRIKAGRPGGRTAESNAAEATTQDLQTLESSE